MGDALRKEEKERNISKDIENEFIEKINSVYKNCTGYEKFGQTTEFYDEDGAIVMTAEEEQDGQISFKFPDSDSFFGYEKLEEVTDENDDE